MADDSYTLPRGSRILVTGANGFIASHVVDKLLSLGYLVRGTVRAPKPWLNKYFEQKYGPNVFETVFVESFGHKDELDGIMDGVHGVVHSASDMTFSGDPDLVIPWVVKAAVNVLEVAALKPTIKRFVLVSSSSTLYDMRPEPNGRRVDQNSWNDDLLKTAWDENIPKEQKNIAVYAASKMEAERQSWNWVQTHQPHFEFNTLVPCFNLGITLCPEMYGSTMGHMRTLLQGSDMAFMFPEQWFVDVEDVARLCIVGVLDPTVKSERIFAFGEQMHIADIINILRELRPNNKKIPDPPANPIRDRTEVLPRARAEEFLRKFFGISGFTSARKSLEAGIEGLK